MIETLIGSGIARPDEKRIVPSRRPLPTRPRDLFEVLVVLGGQASIPSIMEACDLRQTDPRHVTFITLSRWPTRQELEAQPDPYVVRPHLRSLLTGEEFRASLIRRICDAYPERPRQLYVRIPRCAGEHFIQTVQPMHAIIPDGLDRWKQNDQNRFIPALGQYLGGFNLTRTIMIVLPRMHPFVQAEAPAATGSYDETLRWTFNPPPRRPGDRLFTIIREPTGLVLSEVNAILTALQAPPAGDSKAIGAWRTRLGKLPPATDAAAWKALGRKIIETLPLRNPICHALGDGTAEGALQASRLSDIEIADLTLYHDWIKYTWDVEPEQAINTSSPILTPDDLDQQTSERLAGMIGQDLIFYARIKTLLANLGELKNSIRGREL